MMPGLQVGDFLLVNKYEYGLRLPVLYNKFIDINDPKKDKLLELEAHGLAQITQLDGVGAEKFAEHAFNFADKLVRELTTHRCYCVSVECMEHGSNSAIYTVE